MTFEQLRAKARSLPLEPGVYLMHDAAGTVIYVGKAKKLRNRVSQYFQDTSAHTPKTRMMVSRIHDFDVIVAASEFEALVLECSLIKRHQPKYNILLKDDKGYPFVRIDLREPYPSMRMENKALDDGADYFGPFGSRYTTEYLLDTLRLTYRLPGCSKKFPRDVGRERPCLNFQMGNCDGWCRPEKTQEEYAAVFSQVLQVLRGDYRALAQLLRERMEQAAEAMEFERAAQLRDRLRAIEALGKRQLVTARSGVETDAVGYAGSGVHAAAPWWTRTTRSSSPRSMRPRPSPPWSSSTISPAALRRRPFCCPCRWRTRRPSPSSWSGSSGKRSACSFPGGAKRSGWWSWP